MMSKAGGRKPPLFHPIPPTLTPTGTRSLHDVLPCLCPTDTHIHSPFPPSPPSPPPLCTTQADLQSTLGMQGTRTARCGGKEDDGKVGCEQEGGQRGGEEEEEEEEEEEVPVAQGEGRRAQAVVSKGVVGNPLCFARFHPP